jgi:outer membrane translocation and assembly module TamA
VIPIHEGPQYRVGRVSVEGENVFPEKTVMSFLDLETGEIYTDPGDRGKSSGASLGGHVGSRDFQ